MGDRHVWGMIDARPVVFPAQVDEASMALMHWDVPVPAAATLVPEDAFELVPTHEGLARVTLLLADYRRGDWGPSAYASLTVPVRPADDDRPAGLRLCHGVTNAAFTDEVMYWALGVSGALGDLSLAYRNDEVTVRVATDGEDGLLARLPRPPSPEGGRAIEVDVYTCAGEAARRVRYELDAPAIPVPPDEVVLEAGTGPLADAFRDLGLLRPPLGCTWGERLRMTINRPVALDEDDIEDAAGSAAGTGSDTSGGADAAGPAPERAGRGPR
jgi:hypothetical protein